MHKCTSGFDWSPADTVPATYTVQPWPEIEPSIFDQFCLSFFLSSPLPLYKASFLMWKLFPVIPLYSNRVTNAGQLHCSYDLHSAQ